MTLPLSLKAYPDCEALWNAAYADKAGARARVRSYDAAVNLRTRMHYFRNLLRKQNRELFPPDHPQFGTSIYDHLFIQMFPDEDDRTVFWLYVTPRDSQALLIEGLSDTPSLMDANTIDGESHEVRQIAGPPEDDLANAVDEREADLHIATVERRV